MMVHRCVLLAMLGCSSAFASNDHAKDAVHEQAYPFSVESQRDGDGYRVVAWNHGPAPVSVKVSIPEHQNITVDRATPVFAEVPAGDEPVVLLRINRAVKGDAYTFRTFSNWMVGKTDAVQAKDAEYRLPYENKREFSFSQVPGGPITTHNAPVSKYAVDIPMPEGTPIVAAREGIVISTEASQQLGALDPALINKANEVRILHADGTIGTYAHLAHQAVFVVPGQRVKAGAEIGLAGSTGYSSGPHLHLAIQTVQRVGDEFVLVSLPFEFVNGNPRVAFMPRLGVPTRADYDLSEPVGVRAVAPSNEQRDPNLIKVSMRESLDAPVSVQSLLPQLPAWGWLAGVAALLLPVTRFGKRRPT